MEKLNKEELAKQHVKSLRYTEKQSIEARQSYIDYLAGLKYAEFEYLKIIEEKDKLHNVVVEIGVKIQDENKTLKNEIQQAKKLLKESSKPLKSIERQEVNYKIQEFLNK